MSMKQRPGLLLHRKVSSGRAFIEGMFLIVGIGILLGFAGIYCVLARMKNPRVTWPSWLWKVVGGVTLETRDGVCR